LFRALSDPISDILSSARGNGPGGLLEYVQLFRDEPTVQGGLVWEWNNHGLLKTEGDVTYYAYGGDFGDEPNDGVGIMDGLLSSNRTWMPAITEYAKIIQPVNVTLTADNRVLIKNHYDFSDLSGLDATWYIVQDGKDDTKPQQWNIPRIRGGESLTVDLPLNGTSSGTYNPSHEAWLTVEFRLKKDTTWARKGHLIAWDQLHLKPSSSSQRRDVSLAGRKTELDISRKNQTHLSITASSSTIGFDLVRGNVTWNVNGVDIFQRGPELYFYRAQTQKDANADGPKWEEAKVGMMSTNVRDVSWKETEDEFEVHYKVFVAPKVLNWGAEADLTWTVVNIGDNPSLRVHVKGDFVGDKTPVTVPRIGLMAVLPGEFKDVSWFGRGPGESYKDSKQAGRFGHYGSTVEGLFTHYDIPQENGNREDLRWVKLGNSGLTLDARRTDDQPFSFTVQRYSPFDLTDATHPQNLKPLDITVLNLDFNNNGLGSAGPGPGPFSQYRCWTDPFDFIFEFSLV
jgi:beta-galactosidase